MLNLKEEKHIAYILIVLSVAFVTCQVLKIFPGVHVTLWCSADKEECIQRGLRWVLVNLNE